MRPQLNGTAASKNANELNSIPTTTSIAQTKRTFETTALPRKTILRRFGVANKVPIKNLPRLLNKEPLKTSQFVAGIATNDVRLANQTIELSKDAAMNVTKPVINAQNADATMDRSLNRSNTFVCDTVDDTQTKLLSITHNVNDAGYQANLQQFKERTFKRSLSPIPGDAMNAAKRKLMQVSSDQAILAGPILNSTPRRSISYSDARKANLTFFPAKCGDLSNEPHVDQLQTFTFDNNTFEQSNNFATDSIQFGKSVSSTMQNNRMFDLTQTIQQNADTFYPENRNTNQTLDVNVAEHERKNSSDATKQSIDANDGNLTKTINGKFYLCASLFSINHVCLFVWFFLLSVNSCYAIGKKYVQCALHERKKKKKNKNEKQIHEITANVCCLCALVVFFLPIWFSYLLQWKKRSQSKLLVLVR